MISFYLITSGAVRLILSFINYTAFIQRVCFPWADINRLSLRLGILAQAAENQSCHFYGEFQYRENDLSIALFHKENIPC